MRDLLPTVLANWMTNWGWSKICLSVCPCWNVVNSQLAENRQMTDPFMIVGTEDSIHDCAVVMRRKADVSAYEYDIVLSVPWIWEASLYWLWCLKVDNQVHNEKKEMQCFCFAKGIECTLVWVMEQLQASIKALKALNSPSEDSQWADILPTWTVP